MEVDIDGTLVNVVFFKNLSILKKFLFINLIFYNNWIIYFLYLKNVQPNLIKKKSSNHIEIINNTIENLNRLEINFSEEDIRRFYSRQDLSFKVLIE